MKNLNKFGIKDMTQKHIVLGCRKIWHKAWNLWKEFSKGSFEVLSVLQSKYFSQNFLVQLCWALKFTGCKICHRENRETFQRDSSVKRFFVSSQPQQHIRILLMFIAKNLVILSPKYLKNVERGRNDHHAPILDLIWENWKRSCH